MSKIDFNSKNGGKNSGKILTPLLLGPLAICECTELIIRAVRVRSILTGSTYASMVESVDTPDLKSVDHHGRGSSSLPTRINKQKKNSMKYQQKQHTVGIVKKRLLF